MKPLHSENKPGTMDGWSIRGIGPVDYRQWLLNKHYAKRVPQVQHAFGLFDSSLNLQGVCTFGSPCRAMNNGEAIFGGSYHVNTLELNRLCINEVLPKNALSWFVGKCLGALPKPCCVVSYADASKGHHGYIYQATNWIYTGLMSIHDREVFLDGVEVHPRTACSMGFTSMQEWAKADPRVTLGEYTKRHRYFQFIGDRRDVLAMRRHLVYPVLPYPKGDNERYDASFSPITQGNLF